VDAVASSPVPDAAATDGPAGASPREVRRLARVDVTRSQILDTAERSFAELGYGGTSLRALAAECELSVGAIYGFFASKEEIFDAVMDRGGSVFMQLMSAKVAEPIAPDRKLRELAQLQVEHFREHPHWARITTTFVTPGAHAHLPVSTMVASYQQSYRAAMDVQAAIIAEGQQQHLVREGDPQALARMFSAMVSMFHVLDEEKKDVPISFSVAELLDLVDAALRPQP
jgi:AcrR family transcriptional regulator